MTPKINPPAEGWQIVKFSVFKCGQTKKTFFACQWLTPTNVLALETGGYRVVNPVPTVPELIDFIRSKGFHAPFKDTGGKIYDRWYQTKRESSADLLYEGHYSVKETDERKENDNRNKISRGTDSKMVQRPRNGRSRSTCK